MAEKKRKKLLGELEVKIKHFTPNDVERWRFATGTGRVPAPSPWAQEKAEQAQKKMEVFQSKQQRKMRFFLTEMLDKKQREEDAAARKAESDQRLSDFRKDRDNKIEVKRKALEKKEQRRQEGKVKAEEMEQELRGECAVRLAEKFQRSEKVRDEKKAVWLRTAEVRQEKIAEKEVKVKEMYAERLEEGLRNMELQKDRDARFEEQLLETQAAREEVAKKRHLHHAERKRNLIALQEKKQAHQEEVYHHCQDRLSRTQTAGAGIIAEKKVEACKANQKVVSRWEKNFEKTKESQVERVEMLMQNPKHHIYSDGPDGTYSMRETDPGLRRTWSDPREIEGRYSPDFWKTMQEANLARNMRSIEGFSYSLLEKQKQQRARIDNFRSQREEDAKRRLEIDMQMRQTTNAMSVTFQKLSTAHPSKFQSSVRKLGKDYGIEDDSKPAAAASEAE